MMTGQELREIMDARGLNYRQMGELIGYSTDAVHKAVNCDKVSAQMARAVELISERERERAQVEFADSLIDLVAQRVLEKLEQMGKLVKK